MAELKFRIPSKAVPYGFVEVVSTNSADTDDPEMLATLYVNYVYAFQKAEQEALARISRGGQGEPAESRTGPSVGSPEAAVQRVSEGKRPRTVKEAEEMAAEIIKRELGATEVGEEDPPWKQEVAPRPKPWETDEAASKAAVSSDW